MKVAISLGAPYAADIKEIQLENQMTYVVEAERLGAESAWSAEAWGHDAITPLAYLAARTSRIRLGTGIMQIGARTPAMIAMTEPSHLSSNVGAEKPGTHRRTGRRMDWHVVHSRARAHLS
jgi:hypothetical protein